MLTANQEKFCLEYAKCGNPRQAYINAGYKKSNDNTADACASRLLRNAKIQDRLAELTEESKNKAIADIQEMQEVLTKIIRKEVDGVAVKDIINAVEKLGKMQGAFIDRIEADVNSDMTINIELSDE